MWQKYGTRKNKLLDKSYFFLYTWTVAGDGG